MRKREDVELRLPVTNYGYAFNLFKRKKKSTNSVTQAESSMKEMMQSRVN